MRAGSKIESIGVELPEASVTTAEIVHKLKVRKPLKLELLTGISSRRVCGSHEDTLTLALAAAKDCLNHSEYEAREIEMIISCSISKYVMGLNHYYEPSISNLIKQRLGCPNALNFDVSNACAGMITGVHIANNFISRGVVKNCMVVSGEYITSISNNAVMNINSLKHDEVASLTVGDAGAAVILTGTEKAEECFSVLELVSLSQYSDLCIGSQSSRQPGGVMKTAMKKIHEVSIQHAPPIIKRAFEKAGLRMNQIDFLIPHQTSKLSIESGAKFFAGVFGEGPGEVVINLRDTGNTASTTHFTTLYKYLMEDRIKEGDKIMLLSFASGLIIGVIVFSVHDLIKKYGHKD